MGAQNYAEHSGSYNNEDDIIRALQLFVMSQRKRDKRKTHGKILQYDTGDDQHLSSMTRQLCETPTTLFRESVDLFSSHWWYAQLPLRSAIAYSEEILV